MCPGVGGADLPAQRMADHVNAVVGQPDPQCLEVVHQVVQRIRHGRDGALAVSAKVVADAGEVLFEAGKQPVPRDPTGSDPVDHVEGRTLAGDGVRDVYGGHGRVLSAGSDGLVPVRPLRRVVRGGA